MTIKKWLNLNTCPLTGKRVVITGATGGLGREICSHFLSLGADITFACRNKSKAEELKKELLLKYKLAKIDFVKIDLGTFGSVKNAIKEIKKYNGIDILVNNAGIYNVPLKTLDSGFNNIFQINYLYTYFLTKELLPELEKKENSTCITLGSVAHNYSKIDESDIDFSSHKKPSMIYGNSKRFLMFSLYELFKNTKVNLAIVHPGVTLTSMTNHYPKAINWLVKIGVKLFFPNPKKASLSILYGVNHETRLFEWIGPRIFNVWGFPKKSTLKTCLPKEYAKICEITKNITAKLD